MLTGIAALATVRPTPPAKISSKRRAGITLHTIPLFRLFLDAIRPQIARSCAPLLIVYTEASPDGFTCSVVCLHCHRTAAVRIGQKEATPPLFHSPFQDCATSNGKCTTLMNSEVLHALQNSK